MRPPVHPILDFDYVLNSQLVMAIMMDGKWHTTTSLRKRLGYCVTQRGSIERLLRIWRHKGHLRRAYNPLHDGRPAFLTVRTVYAYQLIKPWIDDFSNIPRRPDFGRIDRYKHYARYRHLSKAWRKVLR